MLHICHIVWTVALDLGSMHQHRALERGKHLWILNQLPNAANQGRAAAIKPLRTRGPARSASCLCAMLVCVPYLMQVHERRNEDHADMLTKVWYRPLKAG